MMMVMMMSNVLVSIIVCGVMCFRRTKIFIRFPRVLFATEDALQARKQDLGNDWTDRDDSLICFWLT